MYDAICLHFTALFSDTSIDTSPVFTYKNKFQATHDSKCISLLGRKVLRSLEYSINWFRAIHFKFISNVLEFSKSAQDLGNLMFMKFRIFDYH